MPAAVVQHGPAGDVRVRREPGLDGDDAPGRRSTPIQGDIAVVTSGPRGRRAGGRRRAGAAPPGREGRAAPEPAQRQRQGERRGGDARRRPRAPGAPGPRHERRRLRAVHPAAGRHDAADGRPAARRASAAFTQLPGLGAPAGRLPDHRRLDASCPGGSAETMASAVTTPLERQFGQMPSLTQMTERLELRLLADHAAVRSGPQHRRGPAGRAGSHQRRLEPAARAAARRRRRTRRATRPTSRSSRSRSARTSLPLDQVDDFADSILAQKISQVSGVGLVTINGGQKPAVRVQVDPDRPGGHRA